MKIVDLPLTALGSAPWNPNRMEEATMARLKASIERFGLVVPLVVRKVGKDKYEVIGGAHRLAVIQDLGMDSVSCVVIAVDEPTARLLSQALNHIAGEDNPGVRAETLRYILGKFTAGEVLAILPDSAKGLEALSGMGAETLASHLRAWEQVRVARLMHMTFQLTADQHRLVEEALAAANARTGVSESGNPNRKGELLYRVCRAYLGTGQSRPVDRRS